MRFLKYVIIIALLAGAGYLVYKRLTPHAPEGGGFPGMGGGPPPPVSVAQVVEQDVQLWNEFSGRLVATDRAEIRPRVAGPIQTIHFNDSSIVKKGDPLFTIDPAPYQAAVDQANAAVASAQARVVLADEEMNRTQKLIDAKAISEREMDQRRNDKNVAAADLKSAQAALELAQLNLGYTTVRAPITGRVSRAEVTVGNLVDAGNPVLTTIVADNPIYADFEMDEATYLQYAKTGGDGAQAAASIPVTLGLSNETDTPHQGRIQSFDNQLNTASGTIRVRAVFDNAEGALIPGLFARIRIGGAEKQKVLLITDRAVGTDQNKKFVMVVGPNNMVEYREITLGPVAEGLRVVQSGLKPGDMVIVNGLQRARPGAPVTPEPVPMDNPDAPTPSSQAVAKAAAEAQGGAGAPPPEEKPVEEKLDEPAAAQPQAGEQPEKSEAEPPPMQKPAGQTAQPEQAPAQ